MGRRSRRHHSFCKVNPLPKSPTFVQPTSSNTREALRHLSLLDLLSHTPVDDIGLAEADLGLEATKLRKYLQITVSLIAGLNWAITLLGYIILETVHGYLVTSTSVISGIKAVAVCLSISQILLLVYYWSCSMAYSEVLRRATQPQDVPLPSLLFSPKSLAICATECSIHLFVFLPATNYSLDFHIFGTENGFSLDELCYVGVLIKNYHSLRMLYWFSCFSSLHTVTICHLIRTPYRLCFILRSFLVAYGLPMVLITYGVMVLLPGIFEYMFEHEINTNQLGIVWNNFWVVFYTQTTIGYGEGPPQTFFGQLMIIVSAMFGYFTLGLINYISRVRSSLSLREWTYYSEIRYRRETKRCLPETVLLLQRWWRFMIMRKRKTLQASIIFDYFAQIHAYKRVLVSCARVKDNRFERKIAAFESTVRPKLRTLQKDLSAIEDHHSLLLSLYRSAYQTREQCVALGKFTQKYAKYTLMRASTSSRRSSSLLDPQKRMKKSSQSIAKANKAALQNLKSRLAEKLPKDKPTFSQSPRFPTLNCLIST